MHFMNLSNGFMLSSFWLFRSRFFLCVCVRTCVIIYVKMSLEVITVFSTPYISLLLSTWSKNCDGIMFRIQVNQNQEGSVQDMKLLLVLVCTRMCHKRLLE